MRKLVLGIPAQASGKNLTRLINASGAPDVLRTCHFATPSQARCWLRSTPSMAGRRFGCACIGSTLASGSAALRYSDHTPARTPTGDYAPSLRSPWRAAKAFQVEKTFGLKDPMVIAAINKGEHDVFNPQTLQLVQWLTDEVMKIPEINRNRVVSLATEDNNSGNEEGMLIKAF